MLATLGFITLVIGVVLVLLGYTVEARAIRPGWACTILGIVLILISYLIPTTYVHHDALPPVTTHQ